MIKVMIEAENIGTGWWLKISSPAGGGGEYRPATFDDLLAKLREAHDDIIGPPEAMAVPDTAPAKAQAGRRR
jgi:hypothetical protein